MIPARGRGPNHNPLKTLANRFFRANRQSRVTLPQKTSSYKSAQIGLGLCQGGTNAS